MTGLLPRSQLSVLGFRLVVCNNNVCVCGGGAEKAKNTISSSSRWQSISFLFMYRHCAMLLLTIVLLLPHLWQESLQTGTSNFVLAVEGLTRLGAYVIDAPSSLVLCLATFPTRST